MEGFGRSTEFARYVMPRVGSPFTLVDIGCSGGIDGSWRIFGDRLRVFGFDPNLAEVERLRQRETLPDVTYWAGFVGASPTDPFVIRKGAAPDVSRNPWNRLAAAATLERRAIASLSSAEKTQMNLWRQTELAEPAAEIVLSDFFSARDVQTIDFVKIDVDGKDFEILQSMSALIDHTKVLGFGLEINYVGTSNDTDHTFHNTDRFMRQRDFDLFGLTVRHYSNRRLPGKYLYHLPAQNDFGKPLQGDAVYVKDICAEYNKDFAAGLDAERKLKLAVIYSLFAVPDYAAEIILQFNDEISGILDTTGALDILARQAQDLCGIRGADGAYMAYNDYITAFNNDRDVFYQR
jgi:Methyltransferase FkbM domain